MKLNRLADEWAALTWFSRWSPFLAQQAHEDLEALFAENEALNLRIAELEAECFKLAAAVCEHRVGNDHGNPMCLVTGELIP